MGFVEQIFAAAASAGLLKIAVWQPADGGAPQTQSVGFSAADTNLFYGFDARNVTPDRWLDEGDQVTIGRFTFGIRHCPGHSPGSVVLLNAAQKFAIVGDVLFRGSIGRTVFPYGDHAALLHAIKTKLLPLGDGWAFICGHGPGSTFALEKRTNPYLQR